MSPPAYYAAKFAISGVGFVFVAALLWAMFAVTIKSLDVPRFLPVMALSDLFIGIFILRRRGLAD